MQNQHMPRTHHRTLGLFSQVRLARVKLRERLASAGTVHHSEAHVTPISGFDTIDRSLVTCLAKELEEVRAQYIEYRQQAEKYKLQHELDQTTIAELRSQLDSALSRVAEVQLQNEISLDRSATTCSADLSQPMDLSSNLEELVKKRLPNIYSAICEEK